MGKIKNASSGVKTRTSTTGGTLRGFEPAKATRPGGRPAADDQLNPFIVRIVLRFYVDFLKMRAPKHWNERNINFALFSPEISKEDQTGRTPYNGLGAILKRKSLPRLGQNDRVSKAIFLAEQKDMFVGGLQILFHPYVLMLHIPTELGAVRDLLFNCRSTFSLGFARRTPWGDKRDLRTFEEESLALEDELVIARQDPFLWIRNFLDLIAIALGLTIESSLIGDTRRLHAWKKWWEHGCLKFSDWAVGDAAARETMDRWIQLQLEQLDLKSSDPVHRGFEYLVNHVLSPGKKSNQDSADGASQSVGTPSYSLQELVRLFLSIRDGINPSEKDVMTVLLGSHGRYRPAASSEL